MIDFSQIRFPTDQITLGKLRELAPEQFTPDGLVGKQFEVEAIATLLCEQELAAKAYAEAAGLPDHLTTADRHEMILALTHDYQRYGISSGSQLTFQLVRRFEKEAVKQAQADIDPSRSR